MKAVFTDADGNKEHYVGEMGLKFGLDIGDMTSQTLNYIVFSPTSDYKSGAYALQGKYFGQKADAELSVGGGVQVLIGGFGKSFTLQPLSISETKGYGMDVGMGYLYLQRDHSM